MAKVARDEAREERITMEAVVDANGPDEQAMGWYYYLEGKLNVPFTAQCIAERRISPLKVGETVQVTGMAPEEECEHEMFVEVTWINRSLAVPLAQLEPVDADESTQEGALDWQYWVARGYEFG